MPRYEVTTVESVYERYEVEARTADEAKRKVGDQRQRGHMISMPVGSGGDVTVIEAREIPGQAAFGGDRGGSESPD